MKIRRDDTVIVISGKDRGKTGKVTRVDPEKERVYVEGLNMVKRHSKPRGATSPGGIIEKEAALRIENVMMFCDRCNAPVRIGWKANADDTKSRVCRRCNETLGNE